MKDLKTIYTLGTSTRSIEDFFSVLEPYEINCIADVRRFPKSRKYPHFNRDNLEAEAKGRNLFYQWLGDLLGGYRSGGYDVYMREISFQRGLQKVEDLAKIRLGQQARVFVPDRNSEPVLGKVVYIAPTVATIGDLFIEVEFPNPLVQTQDKRRSFYRYRFRPGMKAEVELVEDK